MGTTTAPILSAPENYSVTDNHQPTISWSAAADAVSYEIQLGQNYPPNGTPISVTQTSYTPPSPLFTTTYYWRVRAVRDGSVKTDWSATRMITISSSNDAAPLRYFYTTPTVTLTWNGVSWATGYEAEIYDNAALMGAPVDAYAGGDTQMTSTLPKEGIYYWRVRALRVNGAGAWSKAEAFGVGSP